MYDAGLPTRFRHGELDCTLPTDANGRPLRQALAEYAEIEGAPHGLLWTHAEEEEVDTGPMDLVTAQA